MHSFSCSLGLEWLDAFFGSGFPLPDNQQQVFFLFLLLLNFLLKLRGFQVDVFLTSHFCSLEAAKELGLCKSVRLPKGMVQIIYLKNSWFYF